MTFKVWNEKTSEVVDRSVTRAANGTNINLKASEGNPIGSGKDDKKEPPNITCKKFSDEEPQHREPDCIEGATQHPSWEDEVNTDKRDRGESPVHNPSLKMQSDKAGNPMLDSMGDLTCVPGINPTDVAGKTFLLMDEDGDKLRFTIDPHDTADDNGDKGDQKHYTQ